MWLAKDPSSVRYSEADNAFLYFASHRYLLAVAVGRCDVPCLCGVVQ